MGLNILEQHRLAWLGAERGSAEFIAHTQKEIDNIGEIIFHLYLSRLCSVGLLLSFKDL